MDYNWINLDEIPAVNDCRILLFGAGAGSEEFLEFKKTEYPYISIAGVADNDASMHGKSFYGYNIIHPDEINHVPFDKIIITSISGRDAISKQLDSMGFRRNRDYFPVGRYPVSLVPAFNLIRKNIACDQGFFKNTVCLNIGPGGNFGLEILLYCYGAEKVYSIDKFCFGARYPDITDSQRDYTGVAKFLESIQNDKLRQYALQRFKSVVVQKNGRCKLDEKKIKFRFPVDICNLPFEECQFDFVFSSGVLEHVKKPKAAVSEIIRVLKKGGVALNRVITRDHRSFFKSSGFHAFSFRNYTENAWHEISSRKFYQNRLLPIEWKRFFIMYGLSLNKYKIEEEMDIDDIMYGEFHTDFYEYSRSELGEINCVIAGKRL